MICPNCEKDIDNNLEVCPYCGCRLAISASIQKEREREEQQKLAAQKEAEKQRKLEEKQKEREERERLKAQKVEENKRIAAQREAEKQRRLEKRRIEQKEREIRKAKKAEEQQRIAVQKESERLRKTELRETEDNVIGAERISLSSFKERFLSAIKELSMSDILIKKDDFHGERLLGTISIIIALLYFLCSLIFTDSIIVPIIVLLLAIGVSIFCFIKNNDRRGALSICIIAVFVLLSIPYYFFYVDNPAVHSGYVQVKYYGEVESCFLSFDLSGNYYHRQYVNNEAFVKIHPFNDDTKCHFARAQVNNYELSFRYYDLTTSTQMGSNLTMSSTETLDRACKYVAELSGKHKGSIFNRPAKNVTFVFTIENANPRRRPENTIFTYANTISCDGVYHNPYWEYDYSQSAMFFDIGDKFSRDFFEISFEYYKLPNDDSQSCNNSTLFTIDTDLRVLEISLGDYLGVSINNGESNYGTAIPTKTETWTRIDLCYDYGHLFINGLSFNVERLNPIGDYGNNIISSVNFASGQCFNGYIRGLVVKSN